MNLSKFAFKIFLKKDTYAVFNNLLFKPILMTKNEINNLWKRNFDFFSKKDIETLKENGIIVDSIKQDKEAKDLLITTINNQVGSPSLMYIIPASGCNLGCKYCFIGKINNNTMTYMTEETLFNALKKFSSYLQQTKQKSGTVLFYGGEPTLKFDLVKKAVNFGKDQPIKIKYSIITNGTLLTDEAISFIKENHIQLSISLDGPKKITDESRIFKNTQESVYETVVQTIEKLKKNSVPFGLSVTLSEGTIKDPTFKQWLHDINVKGLGFNPLLFTNTSGDWKKYYKNIGKFLFELRDFLKKYNITDERLQRKYSAFVATTFKYNDCPARGAEQIVITPNGDVVVCHGYWNKPQNEICGNINKNTIEEIQNSPNYLKWKKNLTVNKSKCLKCPAIKICGGGCAYQSDKLFSSQNTIDKPNCLYAKYTLKELFKRSFL